MLRPLSDPLSRVSGKTFSRKYIALGKIIAEWEKIIGSEFASRAVPVKIDYRAPSGNKKAANRLARLHIATTESWSTSLHYQKDLILERINGLFGSGWIEDIRFVILPRESVKPPVKSKRLLTEGEKKFLSGMLESLEDQELKAKLEILGQEILKRA